MARIDWVEQRLLNWARWLVMRGTGGSMGYAGVDWSSMAHSNAGRDGYLTTTVIPVSEIEASDTHAVVLRLPSELKATVEAVYLGSGTQREKCARLFISEPTLHKRIDRAQRLMADHWLAKQQAQTEERQRVESLARLAVKK